jgi:hypothetical protein
MFEVSKDGSYALLDLVAGVQVNFVGPADRIADVLLELVEGFVEFAQEEGFFGREREQHHDRIDVAVGHPKDEIGLLHQIGGKHAAALVGDVDAELSNGLDSVGTGWLAISGAEPRGDNAVTASVPNSSPEDALSHGAAANVTCANEENGLHLSDSF